MKKFLLVALLSWGIQPLAAQNVLEGTADVSEAKALLENYLAPLGNSLGTGLNNAWWTTAKPHKLGGFDLTLSITPVLLAESQQSFDIGNEGNFTGGETATILGKGDGSTVTYHSALGDVDFEMPDGLHTGGLIVPMLQAGIGLPKGTEVDFRYVPEYDLEFFNIGLMGAGIKHDLLQWIPVANKLPIDLSIMAGHTVFHSGFEVQDQGLDLNVKATTVNLLLSKKIALLTGFAGVGYNRTTTDLDIQLDGSPAFYLGTGANLVGLSAADLADFQFETFNDLKANVGVRVQLTLLAINANYTVTSSGYRLLTAGLGISFR